ncbi:helix-turn-helix transcriptional regulator [Methermicoccus shengliensis]|uniref:DUF7343 domain-containing protein n=1 Tax=Methermicoccus shengliensis TaxID=660064 RepID=A0A832W0Q0_9EURY|nr:hypothetical protein [Methermicoccus shengliensis]KUK04220.1 MAG: Uncharacterized protein XD46_1083 [Euryarchaeota archaeon 55_53]KUK29949.1 MAG: Uncharacterized protein XD62_0952 [Methanosarcinales archeaon 56_1174]MDN5295593.1 hypothetical protein [Methanosarcinales archaeon]HIH70385.1 hypothetical protein [Methermicoccus shengliensis]
MRRTALLLLVLLCAMPCASAAALVHGTVYQWDTLEPLPNVVIEVNTTPHQVMVSTTGTYSLFLDNGTYRIEASYIVDGMPVLYASDVITVRGDGEYVLDLLLFPPEDIAPELPDIAPELPEAQQNEGVPLYALLAIAGTAFAVLYVMLNRTSVRMAKVNAPYLPDDISKALDIIERAGGRITQKELRAELGSSEAKVSLLVSEMEHRGLVEKVKVGRGNVIYLRR